MTLYELRSDIQLLAQGLKLSKDSRFLPRHIDFMIREHRSRGIREEFARNGYIDPSWLQDFGQTTVTPVNSGDDPLIPYTSKKLGKITMPAVVSLPQDKGVYRVAYASKMKRYYYCEQDYFFSLVKGSVTTDFDYYFRVGTAFYLSPCTDRANLVLILDDPMDGYVLLTERVAQDGLTIGVNYTVFDTQITHNATAYYPGQTFTAVNKNYTGNGYVMYTNQKRKMTDRDPYPMSLTLFEFIVMMIFTQDLKYSSEQIADIINDSQDQLIVLQNGQTIRNRQEKKEGA
jgi:hypothetical protein